MLLLLSIIRRKGGGAKTVGFGCSPLEPSSYVWGISHNLSLTRRKETSISTKTKKRKKKKKAEYLLPPPHCFLPDKPINQLILPVALKSELTGKEAEGGIFIPVAIATFSFQEHQYWFSTIQFTLVIFSPVLRQ